MPRPKIRRILSHSPCPCRYFKPRGVPLRHLKEVTLDLDEIEALNLHEIQGLDQKQSALKMGISQPTLHRILSSAYRKTALAILKGYAIRLSSSC